MSLVEKGGKDGTPVLMDTDAEQKDSDGSSHSGANGGSLKPGTSTSGEAVGGASTGSERHTGGAITPSSTSDKHGTYENEAFSKDQEVSHERRSPTSTEQALSNFGDGSVSLGDVSITLEWNMP